MSVWMICSMAMDLSSLSNQQVLVGLASGDNVGSAEVVSYSTALSGRVTGQRTDS